MDKELATAAMKFMMRVQLTGQEVPAFNAVMQALSVMAQDERKEAPIGADDQADNLGKNP